MTRVNVVCVSRTKKEPAIPFSVSGVRHSRNVGTLFLGRGQKKRTFKNDEAFSNFSSQTRAQKPFPRAHKSKEKNRTYRWVSPERGLRFASSLSSRYLSPSRFVPRRRSKIAAQRSVQSARIASSRRGCTPRSSGPRVKPPAPRRSRRRASRTERDRCDRRRRRRRRRLFFS